MGGIALDMNGVVIMAPKQNNETEIYLTPGLSQPAQRALKAAGYTRLEQMAGVTEADLLKLHGVGPTAIETLRHALAEKGLAFAEPASRPAEQGAPHPTEQGVEQVYDSPRDWVSSHIRDYVESDGKKGHLWRGMPTLLLTHARPEIRQAAAHGADLRPRWGELFAGSVFGWQPAPPQLVPEPGG